MSEKFSEENAEYTQHRDQGLRELAAGNVDAAIRLLGRAAHLRPDLPESHLDIARAFERAGKIEAARHAYLRAVELDAQCADARASLDALPPLPPAREDFQRGQRIRSTTSLTEYEILEVNKGGFGVVYIVRKVGTSSVRALKTFQARFLWRDEDRERFTREAATWVMLDRHPNIVTAIAMETIEGFPCLELEYVPAGSLVHLLRQGPIQPSRALELGLQFCDGMEYAYQKLGIVHRDVKPANCLLNANGDLKVTDFGLARAFGEAQQNSLGLSGFGAEVERQYTTTSGTLPYMAPEQFHPNAQLDTRTDVHAFGVMFYQMLTCDLPLSGAIAQAHIRANAGDEVPAALLSLIIRCVEPDPANRHSTLRELRQALESEFYVLTGRTAFAPPQPVSMTAEAWNGKGMSFWTLGRHEEAIVCFDNALEIDPRPTHFWQNKGVALVSLGRYEEAIACYSQGLKIDPRHRDLLKNKGAALWALERREEAITCIDLAIEIDPHDPVLWKNKGYALAVMKRYEESLRYYDKGLQIDSRNTDLWWQKAMVLTILERYEEAIACYDRGLQIEPRKPDLWKAKGLALWTMDRRAEAVNCINRGLEINASDASLWTAKGFMFSELGRDEEAIACCNKGLEISPADSTLLNIKAKSLKKSGQSGGSVKPG